MSARDRDHLTGETAEWLDVDDVDFDQQEQQQPAHMGSYGGRGDVDDVIWGGGSRA